MSYQVLARKWRPQRFADVVGQQPVLTALANSLSQGRIHHAYLFSGSRGVGKTTLARLFAKGLNCETGITATPCGECDACRAIAQGNFVDLIEIDAASRTKVEDTRELLDNVQYLPVRGRFKVYLIDEVHMLSRHSFNALLKTLEEPPPHVKFLLATTDPQKLPVTVLSRCLQFHLRLLEPTQIAERLGYILQQENLSAEPRALQLLARAAEGSLRDALSLTDQAIALGGGVVSAATVSQMLGTLESGQLLALTEAMINGQGQAVMQGLAELAALGVDWDQLLAEMVTLLHRAAMYQLLPDIRYTDAPQDDQRLRELARRLAPEDVQLYYQILLAGRKELPLAPDKRMGAEMTLLRALAFQPRQAETASVFPGAANGREQVVPSGAVSASPTASPAPGAQTAQRAGQVTASASTLPPEAPVAQGGSEASPFSARLTAAGDPPPSEPPFAPQESRFSSPASLAGGAVESDSSPAELTAARNRQAARDAAPAIAPTAPLNVSSYAEPHASEQQSEAPLPVDSAPAAAPTASSPEAAAVPTDSALPPATAQLLQARESLLRQRKAPPKKSEPAEPARSAATSSLSRLARASEQRPAAPAAPPPKENKEEPYRWQATTPAAPAPTAAQGVRELRQAVNSEKTPELAAKLVRLACERDGWAACIEQLNLPRLIHQLALNAWLEERGAQQLCLHLRSTQRHLNSPSARQTLSEALSRQRGAEVELTIVEDDNLAVKTPLEWRQAIYEELLSQARASIKTDKTVQTLQRLFDAQLDEDSIRPV